MGKSYWTSDWHANETSAPNTHSFLRPLTTRDMMEQWFAQCERLIRPIDTLYFVGDVSVNIAGLEHFLRLPKCRRVLLLGDKEYGGKYFRLDEFLAKNEELGIFQDVRRENVITVAGRKYFVSHKPKDCLRQGLPAICGHVHGIWRTQQMPNGEPIINVGIDAWGGIVSEDLIEHQYIAVTEGHYDANCFPNQWK